MIKIKELYRSFVLISLFVFFGLGALVLRYCVFSFEKDNKKNYKTLQKSWEFMVWLLSVTGIIDLRVEDVERLKSIKNSIIVSTHPSFVDIVILMSIIPYSTCFVAEKLSKNPFFKGMVKLLFIFEGKDSWLNDAKQMLDNGLNVIMFPMGTRHRKTEFPRIRRGASLLAQKTGKNIVMLNLEQSFDFLQIHQPFYEAGSEPVVYNLRYLGEIKTEDYINIYPDEVTFKTVVTKEITRNLYKTDA